MKTLLTLAVLLTVGMMGCDSHDPAKWYFNRYENKRFIFQHDHKVYTAECFQSFSVGKGQNQQDATPDCTEIIGVVGPGRTHHNVDDVTCIGKEHGCPCRACMTDEERAKMGYQLEG